MQLNDAIDAARAATERAYAPYSGFRVGAAILAQDGAMYDGCNVENASYGLSLCAERGAVMKMVADSVPGDRKIRLVAIASPNTAPCFPCGACRQVLREFGCEEVVVLDEDGAPLHYPFEEILPNSFGPEAL